MARGMFTALRGCSGYSSLVRSTLLEESLRAPLITIWITSFPYLCKLNGHMVRCIALQWDGSGGSAEDKSVALYFPASVRVASVGLCAYWISKAAAHVISWSSLIEQILDDWCTDVYFMVAKWAINPTYCMQWGLHRSVAVTFVQKRLISPVINTSLSKQ